MIDTSLSCGARRLVGAVASIVGLGAVFGGLGLLSDAERLGAKQTWLNDTPFPNYVVPGLTLLLVVGGGMLATAAVAVVRSRLAGAAAFTMGFVLLIWGVVETATIGYQGSGQFGLLAVFVIGPALCLLKLGWDVGGGRWWRGR